ncbi:uncharacterized protein EDB93DRAFT_1095770 [Suillus bovinus]|uniref:uncharacterized protein n=1 Tax=Suillus bovinus TaxID=48563 RepID=UPI001B872B3A|nr:uncharacterized protein EDB93DRAFT_1095770 [Suillus bovinus]KAG2128935.1 hypothetical protein EDB93DRAFT_1095770 [Suillus bovinus]
MVHLKKSSPKAPQPPGTAQKTRQKKTMVHTKTALSDVQKCKQNGIETHLQATNTQNNYAGHVRCGREWLESHFDHLESEFTVGEDVNDSDMYNDPVFKDAFSHIPNRCSDKALALFMSLKGFHQNLSKTTVESIRLAFKEMWELSDGDRYCGKWHLNEARQCWEGNPAKSAEIFDVLSSVKHKASAEGGDRTHLMAMTKDYMERTLRWHYAVCPLDIALGTIQKVMSSAHPLDVNLDLETRKVLTRHVKQIAFEAGAWMLWTRCFELVKLQRKDISLDTTMLDGVLKAYLENDTSTLQSSSQLYFEIFLSNQKGWQKKVDKGQWEADLRSNHYKIYPRPSIPACDCFVWMLVWIKWLKLFHYRCTLQPNNFIFPAMGANGVVQPGQPISHDTVQKWINESTAGTGILDNFSTHCFHCGAVQYWFMFAPVGQWWMLAKVRWWGGWAEGEHRDTLICYLLDELHAYETDYSNALAPISRGANNSLAGENILVSPASTEELRLVHASVTADVDRLRNDIGSVNNSLHSLTNVVVQATCTTATAFQHLDSSQRFAVIPGSESRTSHTPSLSPSPTYYVLPQSLQVGGLGGHPVAATHSPSSSSTGITGTSKNHGAVPFACANGTTSPKNRSWKDIVEHWLVDDPNRGLKTLLKDWPKEWYQGINRQFASKYHQRSTIALEFINK